MHLSVCFSESRGSKVTVAALSVVTVLVVSDKSGQSIKCCILLWLSSISIRLALRVHDVAAMCIESNWRFEMDNVSALNGAVVRLAEGTGLSVNTMNTS